MLPLALFLSACVWNRSADVVYVLVSPYPLTFLLRVVMAKVGFGMKGKMTCVQQPSPSQSLFRCPAQNSALCTQHDLYNVWCRFAGCFSIGVVCVSLPHTADYLPPPRSLPLKSQSRTMQCAFSIPYYRPSPPPPQGRIQNFCRNHRTVCLRHNPALLVFWICRVLLLGRIVTGIGVGCGFVVAPVYIAEITPPHIRGRLTSLTGERIGWWRGGR